MSRMFVNLFGWGRRSVLTSVSGLSRPEISLKSVNLVQRTRSNFFMNTTYMMSRKLKSSVFEQRRPK